MKIRGEWLRNFDWRAALTNELPAKLVTGVLALLLWLMVVSQQSAETRLSVSLAYVNLPAGLAVAEGSIDTVVVTFKGAPQVVNSLTDAMFPPVAVDVSGLRAGSNSEALALDLFDLVNGAQPVKVEPAQLEIILEGSSERLLPVRVRTHGHPATGFVLAGTAATPAAVRVFGPDSLLRTLTDIGTEDISVAGVAQDIARRVQVRSHHPRLLVLDTAPVDAVVRITAERLQKTVTSVPVALRNAPPGLRVRPEQVTIEVEGPATAVNGLTAASIACYIDAARGADFRTSPMLQVDVPENVTVIRIDPPTVSVEQ